MTTIMTTIMNTITTMIMATIITMAGLLLNDGEYATLANSVVVSFSLCGIVIVKCTSGKSRQTIGDMFLGLCVSIMLGDGVMHIMPHFLGMNFSAF